MAIIVGLSSSPLGTAALDRAVEEAVLRGTSVIVVSHVPLPKREQDPTQYQRTRREVEEQAARAAAAVTERGVPCEPFVPSAPGTAGDALLAAVDERDADLVVVGIRRRSRVGKALLGSTAQDVLLGADCPVLGVKVDDEVEAST